MKHTKGPWNIHSHHILAKGHHIARINMETSNINGDANAKLIAAAPDLYLSLRVLLGIHDSPATPSPELLSQAINQARQALAKSRGE